MPDVVTLTGGSPTDVLVLVNVDETTIFGSGAPNNPLTSGGGTIVDNVGGFGPALFPGNPINPGVSGGNFNFNKASATGTLVQAYVGGMDIGGGKMKTSGLITLTNAEWMAVTDGGGAPAIGVPYYVSDVSAGHITVTAPTTTGHYVTLLGWFVSTNTEEGTSTFLLEPSTPFAHP